MSAAHPNVYIDYVTTLTTDRFARNAVELLDAANVWGKLVHTIHTGAQAVFPPGFLLGADSTAAICTEHACHDHFQKEKKKETISRVGDVGQASSSLTLVGTLR